MTSAPMPRFRRLSREESIPILERNHVGRIAYARDGRVDIEPLHYVYADGWIYGRTAPGRKLEATGPCGWPVAFEVDEAEEIFRWRSVVVHGGFYTLTSEGPGPEREERLRAVHLLRTLIPDTFREDDPVPGRTVLFRISVQEVSGRESVPDQAARRLPDPFSRCAT